MFVSAAFWQFADHAAQEQLRLRGGEGAGLGLISSVELPAGRQVATALDEAQQAAAELAKRQTAGSALGLVGFSAT